NSRRRDSASRTSDGEPLPHNPPRGRRQADSTIRPTDLLGIQAPHAPRFPRRTTPAKTLPFATSMASLSLYSFPSNRSNDGGMTGATVVSDLNLHNREVTAQEYMLRQSLDCIGLRETWDNLVHPLSKPQNRWRVRPRVKVA